MSRSSIATTTASSSRCSISSPPARSRRWASPGRCAGSCTNPGASMSRWPKSPRSIPERRLRPAPTVRRSRPTISCSRWARRRTSSAHRAPRPRAFRSMRSRMHNDCVRASSPSSKTPTGTRSSSIRARSTSSSSAPARPESKLQGRSRMRSTTSSPPRSLSSRTARHASISRTPDQSCSGRFRRRRTSMRGRCSRRRACN